MGKMYCVVKGIDPSTDHYNNINIVVGGLVDVVE